MNMKKTVLITGANKGIGFEAARQLLAKDYFVYIGSRNADKGNAAVAQLRELGFTDVEMLQIDVTNADSVKRAAKELASKAGSLDVLINNAGISGSIPKSESELLATDSIRTVFDTNFFGVIRTTQAFLPLLKKSSAPRIVNVSSDLGSLTNLTNPAWEHAQLKPLAYSCSKAALNAFTIILAHELRDLPFKINSVNPGSTATDLNGHRGQQTVDEGAAPIVTYALIGNEGPTGKFLSASQEEPW